MGTSDGWETIRVPSNPIGFSKNEKTLDAVDGGMLEMGVAACDPAVCNHCPATV